MKTYPGPAELLDHIGIDVACKVAHILKDAYGIRMKMSRLFEQIKEKGFLGKKTAAGFYCYRGKRKSQNPGLDLPRVAKIVTDEDILKRLLYPMINEASRCLEEKVIPDAGAVDIAMILGTGFPPFRAGLLRFADHTGLKNIVADLVRLSASVDHERFTPAPLLVRMAASGQTFYSSQP